MARGLLFAALVLVGCGSSTGADTERPGPAGGAPAATAGTFSDAGEPPTSGGTSSAAGSAGSATAAGNTSGGSTPAGGTGGSAGQTPAGGAGGSATCVQVPDTEPACGGCGIDYFRCGEERAYWQAEDATQFECADASGTIPDCVAAHAAATAWVGACCDTTAAGAGGAPACTESAAVIDKCAECPLKIRRCDGELPVIFSSTGEEWTCSPPLAEGSGADCSPAIMKGKAWQAECCGQ